ncbi:hypothetical protein ACAF76_000520 [Brevibacillus sp. TJ4]|uniref:hypothetical protein n=1 Tax=Brevibacillus sp. TJ4 TaxID=3234853 RepID=UPI0037D3E280
MRGREEGKSISIVEKPRLYNHHLFAQVRWTNRILQAKTIQMAAAFADTKDDELFLSNRSLEKTESISLPSMNAS